MLNTKENTKMQYQKLVNTTAYLIWVVPMNTQITDNGYVDRKLDYKQAIRKTHQQIQDVMINAQWDNFQSTFTDKTREDFISDVVAKIKKDNDWRNLR
jgi:hypothetical protein